MKNWKGHHAQGKDTAPSTAHTGRHWDTSRQPLARPTRPASRQGPKQGPHGPRKGHKVQGHHRRPERPPHGPARAATGQGPADADNATDGGRISTASQQGPRAARISTGHPLGQPAPTARPATPSAQGTASTDHRPATGRPLVGGPIPVLTRQAHQPARAATAHHWQGPKTGRHGPRKDHGGPVDQRTAERPPRATETATTATDGHHHGPTASTADGHQRQGPPASTPASHTDGRHHGGRPRRRPVLAATSTASHTDTATDGGPHGPPLAASTNQFWGVRREPCLYSSACQWKSDQHTSKSCRGRRGHRRRGRAEVARREFF